MALSLAKIHRKLLESATAEARFRAESACQAALENLAVHEKDYRSHMSAEQRMLRNRLRSRGRALGDTRNDRTGTQELYHLIELCAYEHWHRMLFARFLTENNLLITDEANGNVPVTIEECEELAPELGARDGFDLACRFASLTLPGVFRRDDPVLELPVAINDQVELRKILATLPPECFRTDDALGWTYQFWQAKRKKEVNDSGKKIGADELSPVTQLFTEDYMVEFLLHNTLGAWWAGRLGPISADTEADARAQAALGERDGVPAISWKYLRFVRDETTKRWRPAAGNFDSWPKSADRIRLLDPCMGSGHFLVFALPLLVRLRMEDEQIQAQAAVVSVLSDNVFGLELDERCTQIAAFNVALTAWKLAGYQTLPRPNLACSGLALSATEAEWVMLAGDDYRAQGGMARLHSMFKDAPVLGSLINPRGGAASLLEAEFHELSPLLLAALAPTEGDAVELSFVAQGLAKAAELLVGQFTLIVTNVPYLGRGKQDDVLKVYCDHKHPAAKADLATCFVERCLAFCQEGGSTALVTPQNWLSLGAYKKLRLRLLENVELTLAARLGSNAFRDMNWWAAKTLLGAFTNIKPTASSQFLGIDVGDAHEQADKANGLSDGPLVRMIQQRQLTNPDARIVLTEADDQPFLMAHCDSFKGFSTGDSSRYIHELWEHPNVSSAWVAYQGGSDNTAEYAGRSQLLRWENGNGDMVRAPSCYVKGAKAWTRVGISVNQINLAATLYTGEMFDENAAAIVPSKPENLAAVWVFVQSEEYHEEVRSIDEALKITNRTLLKIPFDLPYWQKVATERYPNGLPKPHSNDPTQWLFNGHPKGSDQPLHVAVARLLGYRWPRQTGSSFPDCPALGPDGLEEFADDDGVVCLPPLNHEQPAAARLRQLLTAALGVFDERALIAAAGLKGSKSKNLEEWLRDEFFEQHAKLFQDRPFVWHLWDGRPDGFHALVNYHRLDHATLQKLAYSYLGNWIQQQSEDAKADKPGAAARLGAAQKLQDRLAAILEGEAPLDLFVRWKPLAEQALGWHPDLNDGIRQNIRPFLLAGDVGKKGAGLFRAAPLALKDKDRGTEPERPKKDYPWFWCEEDPGTDPIGGENFVGSRWNSVHLTLGCKRGSQK